MTAVSHPLLVAGLAALLGCGSAATDPSNVRSAKTTNSLYQLTYTPSPDPIPFSELFELDVTVTDASGKAITDGTLNLQVLMPAHGHGMQTSPEISSVGDGHFKISGMKFHMHGDWQLTFAVQSAAGSDSATFVESFE